MLHLKLLDIYKRVKLPATTIADCLRCLMSLYGIPYMPVHGTQQMNAHTQVYNNSTTTHNFVALQQLFNHI